MAINVAERQSRLEELLALQKSLENDIIVGKAMLEIGSDLSNAISGVFTSKNVDITTMSGHFLSLAVVDGKLVVDVTENNPTITSKATSKATTTTGGEFEYQLKDGRKFPRIVDAIEALTGKPCTIKHDGKTFPDGKPILRYDRLTKDMKAAISKVAKPAAAAEPAK